jgi:transposase
MTKKTDEKARRRAEMILKVQSNLMTASAAARELGSRNTYYEWERKGLKSLIEALTDSAPGRPSDPPDSEKEALKRRLDEMGKELELVKARMKVRDILAEAPETPSAGRKKRERPGA